MGEESFYKLNIGVHIVDSLVGWKEHAHLVVCKVVHIIFEMAGFYVAGFKVCLYLNGWYKRLSITWLKLRH
jgi:hypothetical protein